MSNPSSNSTPTRPGGAPVPPGVGVVDVQIVGGGLAGLIAANRAVDAGLTVRLIEKRSAGGGRASSQKKDGFTLNQGPHALYVGGGLDHALRDLGVSVDGAPPALEGARGVVDGCNDLLPGGPRSLLSTSLLSARSKLQLAKLMATVGRIDTSTLGSVTVDGWIGSVTDRQDLQTLLRGLICLSTYNPASDVASADAAVANLAMAVRVGVSYPDDGWQQIVDKLTRRLEALDSTCFEWVEAAVTAVARTDDGWRCSTMDAPEPQISRVGLVGRTLILAAGSPAVVDRLTGTTALAATAGPPVHAAVLDLGLRKRPSVSTLLDFSGSAHHPLYFSRHSVARGLAPGARSLVSLARYLRPDDDMDRDRSHETLRGHAAAAGVTEGDIVMERYLHKLPVAWGMPLAASGGLGGRPPVAVAGQPGLFVAGDWVGNDGLLADASAASACQAVEAAATALRAPSVRAEAVLTT